MNGLYLLRRMAHNNAWTNYRLHRAVGALTAEAYKASRTSFFPSLHLTLTHILFVDRYYVGAMDGRETDLPALWQERERWEREQGFADVNRAQHEVDLRLVRFVEGLHQEGDLDQEVRLPRRDHVQVERRGDVLLHLLQHQVHHRGQAHAMLSGTAVPPPQLDEFFLLEDGPLSEAELREALGGRSPLAGGG